MNTGGLPLSPWLEASDPQGMLKFKYEAPNNLEVGETAVVPIWVGANRQGFAGNRRTYDFRLRVSPAGEGASAARSFDSRFVHQPFLSSRMFVWLLVVALLAVALGMLISLGFGSVDRAVTAISCGFNDGFREAGTGTVLIKEDCGGAPTPLQKGFFSPTGGPLITPTTEPDAPTATAAAGGGAETPVPGVCAADPALGLAVGDTVTLRVDAIVRDAPAGNDTGRRGANMEGTITSGPECAADLVWWEVQTGAGTGWTAEQTQDKTPLILK